MSIALILQNAASNPLMGFLPMVLIFAIFYFVLLLPLQRQRKAQKALLAGLQNGQVVQTSGGIVGTVLSVNADDDTLVIRVKPDNIKIQIVRSAVSGVISEKT